MAKHIIPLIIALALLARRSATAQALYVINISGTSYTPDATGHIVGTPFNNQSLLQEYAQTKGYSDTSWLGLAYHRNGGQPNFNGDTIDVIVRTNGVVGDTLFGLYFGESFGRMALESSSGRQLKRIEYIYTSQNSHSLGSALITDYYFLDSNGNTNNTYIFGNLQYEVLSDATHANVNIRSGSFNTLGLWRFP